jgi:hypothetical protein
MAALLVAPSCPVEQHFSGTVCYAESYRRGLQAAARRPSCSVFDAAARSWVAAGSAKGR